MLILLQLVLIAKIVVVVIFGYGVVVTNCSPLIFEIIVGCMHLLGSLSLFFTKRFTSTTNQPAQPSFVTLRTTLTRSGATSLCGLPYIPDTSPNLYRRRSTDARNIGYQIVSKLHARINYNKCTGAAKLWGMGKQLGVKGTA
jgi:hypothetical protein